MKRIHVRYELKVDPDTDREEIDRVLGFHARYCPMYRTVSGCVDVTTSVELVEI